TFTCERGPSPPYQLVQYRSGHRGLQPRCPRCRFGIARPHTCRPTGLALRRLASRVGAVGREWLKRGLQSRKLVCPPATHVRRKTRRSTTPCRKLHPLIGSSSPSIRTRRRGRRPPSIPRCNRWRSSGLPSARKATGGCGDSPNVGTTTAGPSRVL